MVVALVAVGCGGGSDDSSSSGSNASPPVSLSGTVTNKGTKTASGSMEIELDDLYFNPTFVKATPGQKITIELKNEGKQAHTFTSTALGVDEELAAGTTKKITITAPQTGNSPWFCRFHVGAGMQGAVFVP